MVKQTLWERIQPSPWQGLRRTLRLVKRLWHELAEPWRVRKEKGPNWELSNLGNLKAASYSHVPVASRVTWACPFLISDCTAGLDCYLNPPFIFSLIFLDLLPQVSAGGNRNNNTSSLLYNFQTIKSFPITQVKVHVPLSLSSPNSLTFETDRVYLTLNVAKFWMGSLFPWKTTLSCFVLHLGWSVQ